MKVAGPTLGATVQTLEVPGVTLTEAVFAPGISFPWHAHERACFFLVIEGTATEHLRRSTHLLHRYDLTYKPMGTQHSNSFGDEGARCLIAEFGLDWLEGHEPELPLHQAAGCVVNAPAAELGQRLYNELLRRDSVTPLAVQAICLELLVHVARSRAMYNERRAPRWLRDTRDMLHERCVERLSLEDIAAVARVHPVHLAQGFRRAFGLTIGEYLRRLRVQRAANRLLSTRRPIAEIALECGFCDQSHLSRVFKRVTSVTPAEYRGNERSRATASVWMRDSQGHGRVDEDC